MGRDSAILQGIGVSSSMSEYSLPIQSFGKNSTDPFDLAFSTTQYKNSNSGSNEADMDEQNLNENQKQNKNKRKRIRPAAEESDLRILKKQIMEAQLHYLKEKTVNILLERKKIQKEIEMYDSNSNPIVIESYLEKQNFENSNESNFVPKVDQSGAMEKKNK